MVSSKSPHVDTASGDEFQLQFEGTQNKFAQNIPRFQENQDDDDFKKVILTDLAQDMKDLAKIQSQCFNESLLKSYTSMQEKQLQCFQEIMQIQQNDLHDTLEVVNRSQKVYQEFLVKFSYDREQFQNEVSTVLERGSASLIESNNRMAKENANMAQADRINRFCTVLSGLAPALYNIFVCLQAPVNMPKIGVLGGFIVSVIGSLLLMLTLAAPTRLFNSFQRLTGGLTIASLLWGGCISMLIWSMVQKWTRHDTH